MASNIQIYAFLLRHYLKRRKALRGDLRGFKRAYKRTSWPQVTPSNGSQELGRSYRVETRGSGQFVVWDLEDWTQGGGEPFRRSDDSR